MYELSPPAVYVHEIFRRTRPDVISLAMFMWMDVAEMKRRLDPELLTAAEAAAELMADRRCQPFPPDVRVEVYEHYFREIRRHDAEVPVSLSTESPEVWKRLGPKLGCSPPTYVCGCGPNSTPGRKKLRCNPFTVAVGPVGGFEGM
jgi:hypothetical protein